MQKLSFIIIVYLSSVVTGCSVSKNYNPAKKYPKEELQQDYSLLRNILEDKHPALYWYTSKDSMDYYFDSLYNNIADSMTELQFGWKVLAPLTNKIHCGHTSFGMSKEWGKFIRNRRTPCFPLYVKLWADTLVVTGDLNGNDSIIKRGTLLTSVNGMKNSDLIRKMLQYLPQDGYAHNVNYIRISGNFPYYHRNIFGIYKNYTVGYVDTLGNERMAVLPMYNPAADSSYLELKKMRDLKMPKRKIKEEEREAARSLEINKDEQTATLYLNTFSNGEGRHLKSFLKRSFKKIREEQIKNLVIDLRSNGGGDVNVYVKLTSYIRSTNFKVADSSYAVAKNFGPYTRYIHNGFWNNLGLIFLTKKEKDGLYHFGYWERHVYKPQKKDHFNGNVYVLTNGPTFSASTLFCNAVKGQSNVTIVGEETGGGWHGNSGIMIPDITLPVTHLRVRLPFFKIVQYNHVPKNGRGVWPDIYIPPTVEGVRQNVDRKMEIVKAMIRQSNESGPLLEPSAR